MRVEDQMLGGVGFIAEEIRLATGEITYDPYATGFCVAYKSRKRDYHYTYIVTAKHVITDLGDRNFGFLVNKCGGGVTTVAESSQKPWYFHPTDDSADVAVRPFEWNREIYDLYAVPDERFVTATVIDNYLVGIGDEVATIGLFSPAPGEKRNTPIVRHGNIAMFSDEKIQTELGFADVYLIEARSIGGLSGSPVAVQETFIPNQKAVLDGRERMIMATGGTVRLLGMAQGHWDIKESELDKYRISHDGRHGVNMGIAIVTPASKILETIEQNEVLAMIREQEDEKHWHQFRPTND